MARASSTPPSYQVPALEKGLDVLECLAAQGTPLTQAQIARALQRGTNELFRVLVCLERRGYIERDAVSGAYSLTLRLFTLSHAHSPVQGLLRVATPRMCALAQEVGESCHLSVIHNGELLVIAQEESPRKLRLSVEVGAAFPLLHTASGRLLLSCLPGEQRDTVLQASEQRDALAGRFEMIRARGYEEAHGETTEGVMDLAVLVGAHDSAVQAALTIASLGRKSGPRKDELLPALQRCAREIGESAGLTALQRGVR
ncbi:MAG: IclR family transcriptional regulator [Chloroflexota bacterium]|nr:IclR family transcriptional regulator [Chloroflexota bacterium]